MVVALESELTALLYLNEIYEGAFKLCPLQKFGFGFYKRRSFIYFPVCLCFLFGYVG